MSIDDEPKAMLASWQAIEPLPPEERARVIRWLATKAGIGSLAKARKAGPQLALTDVVEFIRGNGATTAAEVQAEFGRWPNDYLFRATKQGLLKRVARGTYEAIPDSPPTEGTD